MGIVLYGLINPSSYKKESNLRKGKLLGDSLCGAQTPQRVNGSVQQIICILIYVFLVYNTDWELI